MAGAIGKFLAMHWGKALALVLFVSISWYVVEVFQDNKDMIAEIAQREIVVSLKDADIKFLEERLGNINDSIEDVAKKTEALQNKVDVSNENIKTLDEQRKELMDAIGKIELPASCEGQIEWLREQAREAATRKADEGS